MLSNLTTLSSRDAKRILQPIGESGLPSSNGISYYNVGNESLLKTLEEEYFDSFLKDDGASFKLVVGEYGSGKSHFLLCVRDLAWRHGFVVSRTQLSPKECPYDNQLAVYRSVANNIIWHNEDLEIADDVGIHVFLENYFNQMCEKLGVDNSEDGQQINPKLSGWLKSIKRAKVESPSFQSAVYGYFESLANGDEEKQDILANYLRGEPLLLNKIRPYNVNEKMDKANAFRMLRSLCQMIHELGCAGTLLMFDEGDRMVSIGSSKQQIIACDNLREVIERCVMGDLPGTLFIYAVPPSFVTTIAPKYPALSQRIGNMAEIFSRQSHRKSIISLEKLDLPGLELLSQIGLRLLSIYEVAYGCGFDKDLQQKNITLLAKQCAALSSEHHRRLFVKALVNSFDGQRFNGEVLFKEEQVISKVREVNDYLETNEDV
jgi:hypothetical protein